jgi:HD-like signal output (HDOD) protein
MSTIPAAAAPASSAPALEAVLRRLRSADDFPAVAGRVQQLMEVLGDEDASVQKLANLIIQDYGMTVKLLKTANAFQFNRSNVPLVSVTHAIFRMGVKAVRELASSIVVFEHFQRRSPGLRQLLMLSLLSANHAREVAGRTGTVRSEEAYLLGMLRNLGEVVVACYLPAEYAAVLKDIGDAPGMERASCRRILGFEYEELARAVVAEWGMPSVSSVLSHGASRERREPADVIVSFSHELTSAVYRHASAAPNQAVTLLLQKYGSLGMGQEDVAAVLEAGVKGTRETFAQARIRLDHLQLKHQMSLALEHPKPAVAADQVRSGQPISPEEAARSILNVQQTLQNERLDLNKMILVVLEGTLAAGGFDRAMLALVAGSSRDLCGRLGLGQNSEELIARFRMPCRLDGGPIGVAVTRGQELVLARGWELLPDEDRLLRRLNAGAFAIFPLVIEGRPVGALYVDTVNPTPPAEAALAAARQMRDAILRVMLAQTKA